VTAATPNFIIAGVNKAGTTSLFTYLSQHPAVFASSIKETGYFLTYRYEEPRRPWPLYLDYFRSWQGQPVVMEATPGYFYGGRKVAKPIWEELGSVRICILLREPVARLISFYKSQQALLRLPQEMTLGEYVAACDAVPPAERWRREHNTYWGVEGGHYARWLPDWLETFGEDMRVYFFGDFRRQPRATLQQISKWLQIDGEPFTTMPLGAENRSTNYRYPQFQYMALWLNRRAESFWRTNPALKKRLRTLYYRLNGREFVQEEDVALLRDLRERYASSNRELKEQLQAAGYDVFPDWLD